MVEAVPGPAKWLGFPPPTTLPFFILGPQEQRQEREAPARGPTCPRTPAGSPTCPYTSGSAPCLPDLCKTELSFYGLGQTTTRPETEAACSGPPPGEAGLEEEEDFYLTLSPSPCTGCFARGPGWG